MGQFWPYGMASAAPTIATGTAGTSRLMQSAAAPGLKLPISPVLERPPSGNKQQRDAGIEQVGGHAAPPRRPVRSTGNALKNSDARGLRHQTSKK